jgi:hypothetical protein
MPFAVTLVCLYGSVHPWLSSSLSVLAFCGAGFIVGRASRDAGKRIQDTLFAKWGGAPTTQLLRFRNSGFDIHTKQRFHAAISKGLGKALPMPEQESTDPAGADELYRAGTTWLIGQTRNIRTFPLVLKENVAFGFHRNSLGIRPYGASTAVLCILWVLFHAGVLMFERPFLASNRIHDLGPADFLSLVVSAIILILWAAFLNESAVKRAGFAYAERLLQSCDHLNPSSALRSPATKKTVGQKKPKDGT